MANPDWTRSALTGGTPEDQLKRVLAKVPIELEETLPTLDRPLIVENAFPGWQPRMWGPHEVYPVLPVGFADGGVRYPAVCSSIEDQVAGHVEAVKAGCAAIHLHPRDPKTGVPDNTLELVSEVYDQVFERVDAITLQHGRETSADGVFDYISPIEEMLRKAGGNRYCQGTVVLWPPGDSYTPNYTEAVQEGVKFMLDNKIKPIHKLRSSYHVRKMKRLLLDTGIESQGAARSRTRHGAPERVADGPRPVDAHRYDSEHNADQAADTR